MNDIKIKELPLAQTVGNKDDIIIENDSVTQRISISQLLNYIVSCLPIANAGQFGMTQIDSSLTNPNNAADAKAVGDAIDILSQQIDSSGGGTGSAVNLVWINLPKK